MTYIDYLNRFNQFLESSALPPSAQLLYYKLLHVFNRAGWPPTVQVDNQRMMTMLGNITEAAVIRNRHKLIEAGFIQFHSGRKGVPSQYALCQFSPYLYSESNRENDRECDRENDRENDRECDRENDRRSDSHIKNKTKNKTKTKTSPPNPPKGGSRPGPSYDMEALSAIAVLDLPDEL